MFSTLKKDSPLYILDKGDNISLKVAVIDTVSPVKYSNLINPTVDIKAKLDEEALNFNELPPTQTTAVKDNIIVSESKEEMLKEVEALMIESKKVLGSMEYHKKAVERYNEMLFVLNPTLGEKREQDKRISDLEEKFSQIESVMGSMKDMMSKMLSKMDS